MSPESGRCRNDGTSVPYEEVKPVDRYSLTFRLTWGPSRRSTAEQGTSYRGRFCGDLFRHLAWSGFYQ